MAPAERPPFAHRLDSEVRLHDDALVGGFLLVVVAERRPRQHARLDVPLVVAQQVGGPAHVPVTESQSQQSNGWKRGRSEERVNLYHAHVDTALPNVYWGQKRALS